MRYATLPTYPSPHDRGKNTNVANTILNKFRRRFPTWMINSEVEYDDGGSTEYSFRKGNRYAKYVAKFDWDLDTLVDDSDSFDPEKSSVTLETPIKQPHVESVIETIGPLKTDEIMIYASGKYPRRDSLWTEGSVSKELSKKISAQCWLSGCTNRGKWDFELVNETWWFVYQAGNQDHEPDGPVMRFKIYEDRNDVDTATWFIVLRCVNGRIQPLQK
jgi:hypothetical protein